MSFIKKFINLFRHSIDEENKIKKILSKFDRNIQILEVGCGYGKKINLLKSFGFNNILGIDINESIIKENNENGLDTITVDNFKANYNNKKFDLIFLSHIIEHFQYKELKEFLEYYLQHLKENGHLLISSPINHQEFYNDFDHVKPYMPQGFLMVFGGKNSQVQFYSKYILELEDIYFRKWPFRLKYHRSLLVKTWNKLPYVVNCIFKILFKLSFGKFGKTTGWIGLFRKSGEYKVIYE